MKRISHNLALFAITLLILSIGAAAQDIGPPIPQKLTVHSNILSEDRVIWVRTPPRYDQSKDTFPVLYLMDGPDHINEIGSTIDFLVRNDRMPQLIVVGIANTDRTRDLTPTSPEDHDARLANPTSGGGDRFLDFIQTELMPEIEKRYRTASYRIFAGHSLGGLMVVHTLCTRPDMFQAYIAVSPSLWWDNQHTLHEAQAFLAAQTELNKILFFSLGSENDSQVPMAKSFEQFQKTLGHRVPKDFRWSSARYPDEDHNSTVLRAHYAGLRFVFADWQIPRDPNSGFPVGGMQGMEQHFRELSARYGYQIPLPENEVNRLGYQLMGAKKLSEAIDVFQRNVELYPGSGNVYDSLGEAYENAGRLDLATQKVEKAIEVGAKNNDPNLELYKEHLKRVIAKASATPEKSGAKK